MTTLPPSAPASLPAAGNSTALSRGYALNARKHYSEEKINAVAQDFEAQFVSQMLEGMFSTVDLKGGLGGSDAEETYHSLLVNEYGKVIAKSGGLGIAAQIKRDMMKYQEV